MKNNFLLTGFLQERRKFHEDMKGFNIFKYMFNWYNEKYLHSSFICMLISHNKVFKNLFIEELMRIIPQETIKYIEDKKLWEKCEIYPNKDDHSEKLNIDILLKFDKEFSIVIENKLFACDREVESKPQVIGYVDRVKRYYNIPNERIAGVYLSLRGLRPKNCPEKDYDICLMSYDNNILHWIRRCYENCNDSFLKEIIRQYMLMLDEAVNTVPHAERLIRIISKEEYNKEAHDIYCDIDNEWHEILKKEMIHAKWHAIDNIIRRLEVEGKINIADCGIKTERDYHETITKIANIKKDGNMSKNALVCACKKQGIKINDFRDTETFRNLFMQYKFDI